MRKLNKIPSDLKVGDIIWCYKIDNRLPKANSVKVEPMKILQVSRGYNRPVYLLDSYHHVDVNGLVFCNVQRTIFYMNERDDEAFKKDAASMYEEIRDSLLSKAARSNTPTDLLLPAAKAQKTIDRIMNIRIEGPEDIDKDAVSDLDIERMRERMMELMEAK